MLLDIIRGMVRPYVTFSLTCLIIYLAFIGHIDTSEIVALYGPILGFWFGQRNNEG